MPTLPSVDQITRQAPRPSGQIASYQGGITQSATAEAGQSLARAGEELYQLADKEAERLDNLKAEEAYNRLRQARLDLTLGEKGYMKIQGGNVIDQKITDLYPPQLEQQVNDISGTLLNERQKTKFKQLADREMFSFKTDILGHAVKESEKYQDQVTKGIVDVETENAKANWADPNKTGRSRERIVNALSSKYEREGMSADAVAIELKKDLSNLHAGVIQNALDSGNLTYASKYLDDNKKEMMTDTLIKANQIIKKETDTKTGLKVAEDVFKGSFSKIVPNDFDRAFNILLGTESGGKQFGKDGKPLTSSAGAIGIAQVMPTTGPEAAKLAGVKWDEEKYKNDAQYNAMLGQAYFKEQISSFGGDLAKAYAAYNAGPGATQDAIKKSLKDGKPESWLTYLPAETQNYVAKNVREYGSGGGVGKPPTLEDLHNQVREVVGDNPTMLKIAMEDVTKRFEDTQKAIKQKDEQAVTDAMQAIQANGGRYSLLPASIKASIPAKEVDNVISFAQKISKGDDVTDFAWYQKLTNDQYLKSLSDNEFYKISSSYLSREDAKHFANERNKLNGQKVDPVQDISSSQIKSVLNSRLNQLGIDPTPKDGTADAERVGAINEFVRKSIANTQAEQGKKLTDVEIEKHIDKLFQSSVNTKTSILGIGLPSKQERLITMKVGDIPAEQKKEIESFFKKHGVSDPTDGDILGAYFQMKSGRKSGASGGW